MSGFDPIGFSPLGQTNTQPISELVGNDLDHNHTLEKTGVNEIFELTGNDLDHNHTLDQTEFNLAIVPNDLDHEHRLEGIDLTEIVDLDTNSLHHDHRLDKTEVTEIIKLVTNELAHEHRLATTDINIIYITQGNDMRHQHRMEILFAVDPLPDTVNPPNDELIKSANWGMRHVTARSESPFTLESKSIEMHGERWEGEFELIPMDHWSFKEWKAWLALVEGKRRKFRLHPPHEKPRGSVSQNGTVKSINRPNEIVIEGLQPFQADAFKSGDYIETVDTEQLFMVIDDTGTNGQGEANVNVKPRVRKDATGSVVETQSPRGTFGMTSNEQSWDEAGGVWNESSFTFIEIVGDN